MTSATATKPVDGVGLIEFMAFTEACTFLALHAVGDAMRW